MLIQIQILYLIILAILIIIFSNTLTLPLCLINKGSTGGELAKNILFHIIPSLYQKGLKSPIYMTGTFTSTNRIDIVTSNHISTFDFFILISLIRQYDDRNVYCVFKKGIILLPAVGLMYSSTNDIIMNRKLDDDQENIINTIKKIKTGIIIIMPEGTRYTPEKHKLSHEFSITNNLQKFDNLLYPKMKGLWVIYNALKEDNKMGHIIDITILLEKLRHKNGYASTMLSTNIGNTIGHINTYQIPSNMDDYNLFKSWFLQIWTKKDNILTKMFTKDDINIYKTLKPTFKSSDYILFIFIIFIFMYFTFHTKGMFIVYSVILSYIITMYKGFFMKK